jgi:hypothetical protein
MKTRYAVLLVMLAVFAAVLSQKAIAGKGASGGQGGTGGIPLPAGQFSSTAQGSFAICLNSTTFALESCTTSGVLAIPQGYLATGAATQDNEGNSCAAFTQVVSDLPVDASPPSVTPNTHVTGKLLNYDSTTGTGDNSFIAYTGGTCNGVTFDSTGATEVSNGTSHFVVTDDGKRIDFLFTTLTNSTSSIGDFSLSGTDLRQTRPEF